MISFGKNNKKQQKTTVADWPALSLSLGIQLSFMWFTVAISWVLVGLFYLTIYYILLNFLQARYRYCW